MYCTEYVLYYYYYRGHPSRQLLPDLKPPLISPTGTVERVLRKQRASRVGRPAALVAIIFRSRSGGTGGAQTGSRTHCLWFAGAHQSFLPDAAGLARCIESLRSGQAGRDGGSSSLAPDGPYLLGLEGRLAGIQWKRPRFALSRTEARHAIYTSIMTDQTVVLWGGFRRGRPFNGVRSRQVELAWLAQNFAPLPRF
jgi:hypothetical protein